MSLLFETIMLRDGVLQKMEYHNSRLNHSRNAHFNVSDSIDLNQEIQVPASLNQGIYKCKVLYGNKVEGIEFEPYLPRIVKSLRLIEDDTISYDHKYTDRGRLNALLTKRGSFDDILIVKNGQLTDTSYSNILFFDGTKWFTPSAPLLHGTMRSFLLANSLISETEIKATDLKHFKKARLINAMLPLESGADIEIKKISF